jgi:molybdopterin synthase sulfur carrier subunit
MRVEVRYFASLREALGGEEAVELPAAATIATLRDVLIARGGRHGEALARARLVRSARNRAVAAESTPLADGDEVAFFPPVTGG